MSWWMWILLWVGLVLCAVLLLGQLIYRVIIKGISAAEEFTYISENFSRTWDQTEEARTRAMKTEEPSALFKPVAQSFAEYEQGMRERSQQRISRRIQKRDTLGQPQRWADLEQARKGTSHG